MRRRRHHQPQHQSTRFVESLEARSLLNGTITGNVHNDVNGSGIADESSLTPATVVYLDANLNGRRDSAERFTTTDAVGNYRFDDVPGGNYVVSLQLPTGWVPSNATANAGFPVIFRGDQTIRAEDMMIRYRATPWGGVGQNGQHTGISPFRGAPVSQAQEVTTTDPINDPDSGQKIGTPLFTKFNTAIVPVVDQGKFKVRAFSRAFGVQMWEFESDFVLPPNVGFDVEGVAATFQPALDANGRLYIPGAGGTVHMIGAPDQFNPASRRLVFYGADAFDSNKKAFRRSLFINTGLTTDQDGNVYFGVFRKPGDKNRNPLGIESSLARVHANGSGARMRADILAGSAPALSLGEKHLYVATRGKSADGKAIQRLERFETATLSRAGSVNLMDPSRTSRAIKPSAYSVSLPTVAPDGDVYLVVPSTRPGQKAINNGWLLRFSADLRQAKTPAPASVSQTVAIVPSDMMQGYTGRSSYLVAVSYIDDTNRDGLPARLALLDPSQVRSRRLSGLEGDKVTVMREVRSIGNDTLWVSRPVAVDPSSRSIFAVNAPNSGISGDQAELVRWNLAANDDLGSSVPLASRGFVGSSVVIGPDGQVYTVTDFRLFAAF